ncbi:HPr family phosphocarrier protein [Clostridiaceae bacterium]|mgnify:CR=1 FL=1|jgi:Phosphotransferase System HPr (HPr) Family|nr:HPr family phosphocarrier protein [Lachnospiraceae bacterium]NBH18263.1 HPr family phosphocarrier protein [Clostridiaceae bacterium]
MKTFEYTITDPMGIHARPAGMLVQEFRKYKSRITLSAKGRSTDGRKLMVIMGMGIKQGDTVTVSAEGEDEEEAITALERFFSLNL